MIVLGRIIAPYGVRGWVRLHPFGDDPSSWKKMSQWWLSRDESAADAAWQSCKLEELKLHAGSVVVRLSGVETREAAEALKGFYVGAPREQLPDTAEGEYYWDDLVGLAVINEQGDEFGPVISLIETGANQVLVVGEGENQRLLPFIDQVVKKVDRTAGRIEVEWGSDW